MKQKTLFIFFILLIIGLLASGCGIGKNGTNVKTKSTGTDGIVINYMQQNPQDKYLIGTTSEPISVIVEVRNRGTWPQRDTPDSLYDSVLNDLDKGKVYLSGFDSRIIQFEPYYLDLNKEFLPGLGLVNPDGGFWTAEFKGLIVATDLIVDSYDPTILATACFPYITRASPSVCVDPAPFDINRKKVCKIGTTTLTSQGAPIAVTKIEQQASQTKTQFKITIKNVGKGEVLLPEKLEACDPRTSTSSRLERRDFDKVEVYRVSLGTTELLCGPYMDGRFIQIYNGEGFVICSMDSREYDMTQDAYMTPLNIELRYAYRTTITKQIKIQKLSGIN